MFLSRRGRAEEKPAVEAGAVLQSFQGIGVGGFEVFELIFRGDDFVFPQRFVGVGRPRVALPVLSRREVERAFDASGHFEESARRRLAVFCLQAVKREDVTKLFRRRGGFFADEEGQLLLGY